MFYTLHNILSLYNYSKIKKANIKNNINKYIASFCSETIDKEYIKKTCNDKNNNILFFSINNTLTKYSIKNEIVGCIIYRNILNTKYKQRLYIPLIVIHNRMRSCGYGELLMDEFIERQHKDKTKLFEITLLSLPSSIRFYRKYGFYKNNSNFIERNEDIANNEIMSIII